jgi:hypothetical protein
VGPTKKPFLMKFRSVHKSVRDFWGKLCHYVLCHEWVACRDTSLYDVTLCSMLERYHRCGSTAGSMLTVP